MGISFFCIAMILLSMPFVYSLYLLKKIKHTTVGVFVFLITITVYSSLSVIVGKDFWGPWFLGWLIVVAGYYLKVDNRGLVSVKKEIRSSSIKTGLLDQEVVRDFED